MNQISFVAKQILSVLSATVVTLNLGFWMFPLIIIAMIRSAFGQSQPMHNASTKMIEFCYRAAAMINSSWMTKVIGVNFNIKGTLPVRSTLIIIANHQTWFDIPILQHVVTGQGPVLKFLIKRELIWLPIVGWICFALNFPRLNRGRGESAQRSDFKAIEAASSKMEMERGALMIFAEGTRITFEKHKNQKSPYKKLLIPKPGGLKIALSTMPADTMVLDMTINYNGGPTNFWRCLHGANKNIDVLIKHYEGSTIKDPKSWLNDRWKEKDTLLE